MTTRLDLGRVPMVALLLAPLGTLLLMVWLTPDTTRQGFAMDLASYRTYGLQLLAGSVPYREFPVEYPPLALLPMALPLLGPPPGGIDDLVYLWRFTFIEATLAVATGRLLYGATGGARSALLFWTLLVAAAWVSLAFRYDLWPVVCVLVAVLVADRRPGAAGVALGLGTMLKLFPLVVLPVLGAAAIVRRDRAGFSRLLAGCGATVLLVMGAAWLAAGPSSLDWLRYQADRGLQVESLGAGLLLSLHLLVRWPVDVEFGFGSVQLRAPGSDLLADASPLVLVVLLSVVVVAALRRFRADAFRLGEVSRSSIVVASTAAIAALMLGSKVLSVQYLLWLLPFVPLLPGRMRWLALVVTALSTAIYTADYEGLWHLEPLMILALALRNALIAWLGGWLVVELWDRGSPSAIAPPIDPTLRLLAG